VPFLAVNLWDLTYEVADFLLPLPRHEAVGSFCVVSAGLSPNSVIMFANLKIKFFLLDYYGQLAYDIGVQEMAYIYTLSDPRNGEVRYVGKAFDIRERLWQHLSESRKRNTRKTAWIKSLCKIGLNPVIEILESFPAEDVSTWQDAERFWIQTLRFYGCRLTNLDAGGIGGGRACLETRRKISAHSKARIHTAETRAKISASCKARMTEAEKQHLRDMCSSFRHTEEMKKHLSEVKLGIPKSPEVRAALLAGSLKWKQEHGFKPPKICVHCKIIIGRKVGDDEKKWFVDGIGYLHKRCRRHYDIRPKAAKVQVGQSPDLPAIGGSPERPYAEFSGLVRGIP